ncbi:MAG TPA: iron ABC transporter permease [Casimicrobiaceae bacterium]|nr:iron ABC transporter permease [Casimicrobiaceae bacterium]
MQVRVGSLVALATALLVAVVLVAAIAGQYPLTPGDVLRSLWRGVTGDSTPRLADEVLWQIRLPRIALAALVGFALGAAGAAFQHLFRNPLVAPDTLGVSSGAALGAVVAMFVGASALVAGLAAFGAGLLTVAFVMLLAARIRAHDPILTLVLIGVVVASLCGAAVSLAKFVADPYNQLPAITFWLLGSFAGATWNEVGGVGLVVALAFAVLVALAWRVNLLALAEDEAHALGVDVGRLRGVVIVAGTLATAASVAACGIIGWVGLVVPHMARLVSGPEFSRLLPVSALFGAIFTLGIDTLARAVAPLDMPPGVLTAFVGTPLFLALLARRSV